MKTILVVDDEEHLRGILKKILEKEGYRIETAQDGGEALQMFKEKRFDLLVTDLRMPVKGGAEMLEEIEGLDPEIKVILITGYPLESKVQRKVESGRYAYFAKPFDNALLLEKVRELLP